MDNYSAAILAVAVTGIVVGVGAILLTALRRHWQAETRRLDFEEWLRLAKKTETPEAPDYCLIRYKRKDNHRFVSNDYAAKHPNEVYRVGAKTP